MNIKPPPFKRVIQLELNEISYPVIASMMARNELPNFQMINRRWHYHETTSETTYNKIEPWIQWVTAHTGKQFAQHQIFRLGDAHELKHPQLWETLSNEGIESGIIGSLNTIRRATKAGMFFSDPWAVQNDSYPEKIRPLWNLISSRVKGHATSEVSVKDMLKGLQSCLSLRIPPRIYLTIANQMLLQKKNKLYKWRLAAIFDLFQAEIFKSILKSTNFGYYTLLLNSVAHYQHHYWRNFDRSHFDKNIHYKDIGADHDPISFGYKIMDQIIGDIFKMTAGDQDTLVLVVSGLSQEPYVEHEAIGGMNYYRLIDHAAFAKLLGLDKDKGFEVYPLMSRDWQIKYSNEQTRLEALKKLSELTIKGEALFSIKENTKGFIFIETKFYKAETQGETIKDGKGTVICLFDKVFSNIAIKSGHHRGEGNLWVSKGGFSSILDRHSFPLAELYDLTLEALGVTPMPSQFIQKIKKVPINGFAKKHTKVPLTESPITTSKKMDS